MKNALAIKPQKGKKNRFIKPRTVALYGVGFAAIITFVAIGYRTPQQNPGAVTASVTGAATGTASILPVNNTISVNELIATNAAAAMAETTGLPVADNVANLSVSLAAKSELTSSSDTTSVTKQQIIQPTSNSREIATYTTIVGDTADSVAAKYGISKDTLKWANNLTSDVLDAGKELKIPPVDGIVYTVKSGDTIESLAEKYKADAARIVAYNDLEISGITQDTQIIIPNGDLPATERPGYVAPVTTSYTNTTAYVSSASSFSSASVGNRYAYGYCTWYAYERRAAMGKPVGSFWGNANTWAAAARSQGFTVSNVPVAGAVFQTSYGGGGYGHVGIIDSVDLATGTVTYSDMNGLAGWSRVGTASTSIADAQARWTFIY